MLVGADQMDWKMQKTITRDPAVNDLSMRHCDLFLGTYTFWFVLKFINLTTLTSVAGIPIDLLNDFAGYLTFGMLMVQIIFCQEYTWMELFAMGIVAAIIVPVTLRSSNFALIYLLMFVAAAKKTDFDAVIRHVYRLLLVLVPMVIVLCGAGLIRDSVLYRNNIARHSLGFSHPNTLGQIIFQLMACHFYVNRIRLRARNYCLLLAATLFAYIVPNSQTCCICLVVLLLAFAADGVCGHFGEAVRKIYGYALAGAALLFNVLSVTWSVGGVKAGTLIARIDSLLSIRFSACHRVFQLYGVRLFGNHVLYGMNIDKTARLYERLYLDNGYMTLLLCFGLVGYGIFSLAFLATMMRCISRSRSALLIILFVFALYGVMESGIFQIIENIFLICFSDLLYGGNVAATQVSRVFPHGGVHTDGLSVERQAQFHI